MRKANREVKDRAALIDIMRSCGICRLALFDSPAPYILPLNFGFEWEDELRLYFHCATEGKKLDLIKANPNAGFEISRMTCLKPGEKPCDWSNNYESVIGSGVIEILTGENEKKRGLDALMHHYGVTDGLDYRPAALEKTTVLMLSVNNITGKRLNK